MRRREKKSLDTRIQNWVARLTLFRALRTIVGVAIFLVAVAATLERIVEPDTFTSMGLAYWWAIVTVTTVGYGDIVPESPIGRIVASLLMLTGLSLIPTLTTVVISIFLTKRSRADREAAEAGFHEHTETLARIEDRLERMEQAQSSS
jgi:voltage-gated potassium channel